MSGSNQFSLLRQRRFAPFFATQFLGALNNNVFRNGLVILITFQGVIVAGMNHNQLANVSAGLLFCRSSCSRPRPASSPTSTRNPC